MRVRAHHLLCLATFRGEGYSPSFVEAMWSLWRHGRDGGSARLVVGPDDLCATCPSTISAGCGADLRDRRLLEATGWTAGEEILVGERVRALIPERRRWTAGVCPGCPWRRLCDSLPAAF